MKLKKMKCLGIFWEFFIILISSNGNFEQNQLNLLFLPDYYKLFVYDMVKDFLALSFQ